MTPTIRHHRLTLACNQVFVIIIIIIIIIYDLNYWIIDSNYWKTNYFSSPEKKIFTKIIPITIVTNSTHLSVTAPRILIGWKNISLNLKLKTIWSSASKNGNGCLGMTELSVSKKALKTVGRLWLLCRTRLPYPNGATSSCPRYKRHFSRKVETTWFLWCWKTLQKKIWIPGWDFRYNVGHTWNGHQTVSWGDNFFLPKWNEPLQPLPRALWTHLCKTLDL